MSLFLLLTPYIIYYRDTYMIYMCQEFNGVEMNNYLLIINFILTGKR